MRWWVGGCSCLRYVGFEESAIMRKAEERGREAERGRQLRTAGPRGRLQPKPAKVHIPHQLHGEGGRRMEVEQRY